VSAVFDTNVWVSAFQFGGRAAELAQLAKDGEIEVFLSQAILDETLRVLREKFNRTDLEQIRGVIEQCTKRVEPSVTLDAVKNDPDDNKILECAVAAGADTIVTGDKRHLLPIRSFQGISIVGVAEFLSRQRER
jgi:uncharacterized protein